MKKSNLNENFENFENFGNLVNIKKSKISKNRIVMKLKTLKIRKSIGSIEFFGGKTVDVESNIDLNLNLRELDYQIFNQKFNVPLNISREMEKHEEF